MFIKTFISTKSHWQALYLTHKYTHSPSDLDNQKANSLLAVPYVLVLASCWQKMKYVGVSGCLLCVYLVVEVVECRFVFCKLLHKALWKIPDP